MVTLGSYLCRTPECIHSLLIVNAPHSRGLSTNPNIDAYKFPNGSAVCEFFRVSHRGISRASLFAVRKQNAFARFKAQFTVDLTLDLLAKQSSNKKYVS